MKSILDLGNMPLVNNLFDTAKEALQATKYKLNIVEKENLTMKLDTIVPPHLLFGNYLYHSGVSAPYKTHCKEMWDCIKKYNPRNILDIGGNDGTLLHTFKQCSTYDLELTNVDPSISFVQSNKEKGIKFYNEYWGKTKLDKKVDTITSTNVFQHTEDIHLFLKGIKENLDGIWVLEFPYFLTTVQTNQYDQTYHEHVYYWLVTPLVHLFKEYGLKIIDIQYMPIHGGSLRIISSNKKEHVECTDLIQKYISDEKVFNFSSWQSQITKKIERDNQFLHDLKGTVILFGAAAKGVVYLNTVDNTRFKYVIDDTPQKQNKFLPGTSIQVLSKKLIKELIQPDYILILAHNFKTHIIRSLREEGYKGKFLNMIPQIEIT